MTPAFIVYLLMFTVLLALAAAAIEWGARGRGATRHIWTAAIALSILGPAAGVTWHMWSQRGDTSGILLLGVQTDGGPGTALVQLPATQHTVWTAIAQEAINLRAAAEGAVESVPQWNSRTATLAIAAWLLLSLALCVWVIASVHALRRSKREWTSVIIDGVDVDVSPSTGPAVFGFRSHRIVIPEWATRLDVDRRRLIIAHESEHINARDPQRLALALATLTLMPWNIALWWCATRLRRAIELDCDDRVLRRFPDAREYGYVLLDVAARGHSSSRLAIPMVSLLRLPSELELRLRAMTRPHRVGYRSATIGAVLALIAVSAAFTAPAPWNTRTYEASVPDGHGSDVSTWSNVDWVNRFNRMQSGDAVALRAVDTVPDRAKRRAADSLRTDSFARAIGHELNTKRTRKQISPDQTYLASQVEKPARTRSGAPIYPAALRSAGIGGEVDIEYTVDTTGRIDPGAGVKVTKSTDDLFKAAVLGAVPNMRFYPAEIDGRKVRQLVRQPFTFAMDKSPEARKSNTVYSASQVEKPVAYLPGSPAPEYPPALRKSGVGGEVRVRFLVDTLGRVEPGSIRITMSTNRQFADAVLTALPKMAFVPAEIAGRKVSQEVYQPFTFATESPHQ